MAYIHHGCSNSAKRIHFTIRSIAIMRENHIFTPKHTNLNIFVETFWHFVYTVLIICRK